MYQAPGRFGVFKLCVEWNCQTDSGDNHHCRDLRGVVPLSFCVIGRRSFASARKTEETGNDEQHRSLVFLKVWLNDPLAGVEKRHPGPSNFVIQKSVCQSRRPGSSQAFVRSELPLRLYSFFWSRHPPRVSRSFQLLNRKTILYVQ